MVDKIGVLIDGNLVRFGAKEEVISPAPSEQGDN